MHRLSIIVAVMGAGILFAFLPGPLWLPYVLLLVWTYGVVLPLGIRFGTRIPKVPPVRPFDPGQHDATLEQLTHLSRTRAQLAPLGFLPIGELFVEWPRQPSGAQDRALVLVLDNDAGTRALATASAITTQRGVVHRETVELVTRSPGVVWAIFIRVVWPLGAIRDARARRRASSLLAELDLSALEAGLAA